MTCSYFSTYIINDAYPLRYRVEKREKLEQDRDLLCNQIRTIDNQRIISDKLPLKELLKIDD